MTKFSTVSGKAVVERELPPGHPGREAVLALPDEMEEAAFDAIWPTLLRLLLRPTHEQPR